MVENSDSTKLCTCGTRKHFGSSMDHKDGANSKIILKTFNHGRNCWKDISNLREQPIRSNFFRENSLHYYFS